VHHGVHGTHDPGHHLPPVLTTDGGTRPGAYGPNPSNSPTVAIAPAPDRRGPSLGSPPIILRDALAQGRGDAARQLRYGADHARSNRHRGPSCISRSGIPPD